MTYYLLRMKTTRRAKFTALVRWGRRFEAEERAGWIHIPKENIEYEAKTSWGPRRGRIDIKIREGDGSVAIVEIKATKWDALKAHRIRPTALRHARQLWRYINDHVETQGKDVCPAVVYEFEPRRPENRALVEQILSDRFIQTVWRKERSGRPQRDSGASSRK